MRRTLLAGLAALLLPLGVQAQLPTDLTVLEGFLAWDRGDYHLALELYLRALDGPEGDALVEEIAALTGEVYHTEELTPDGASVAIAPSGLFASWEAVRDGLPVTHLHDLEEGERFLTLPGWGAAFGSGGQVAYLAVEATPEIRSAMAEVEATRMAGDRQATFEAQGRADALLDEATELRTHRLLSGNEVTIELDGAVPRALAWPPQGGPLWVLADDPGQPGSTELWRVEGTSAVQADTPGGVKTELLPVQGGDWAVYRIGGGGRGGRAQGPPGPAGIAVTHRARAEVSILVGGREATVSADGSTLAFVRSSGDGQNTIEVVELGESVSEPRVVLETEWDLSNPALSPDGSMVAYQKRPIHDWEVFAKSTNGSGEEVQLSREIQHDLSPVFIDDRTILAAKGEGRHRRSFLYRLGEAGAVEVTKLFHNNTVRTIAPEYAWQASADGRRILIQAERDGDTVSPERGVYVVHTDRPVTRAQLRERLETSLAAELDLRARGEESFGPIAEAVRDVVTQADVSRIYQYAAVLHSFDSKYITEPGNRMASEYLAETLRSWGYQPELQWFDARGNRTANVIARLPGTVNPELVYTVSSHYDSTQRGPGADDNSSGTTALLEAARIMKDHPRPATIEFAFFTGEEAGLLGSREYVRRAQESGKRIVGALNNDMVGWANNHRLDNTIRYSNPGIRDIQHAAAFLFTDLITYDALYYKSTDAAAYYEAYGDIVGGIGSYPVLGNPHYHQFTDRLVTINQQLVTEVSKTTVATLMLLASSPSRLGGVVAERSGGSVEVRWDAAVESGVDHYLVEWTEASGTGRSTTTEEPSVEISGLRAGTEVRVKAVNGRGMAGWDWARVVVPG